MGKRIIEIYQPALVNEITNIVFLGLSLFNQVSKPSSPTMAEKRQRSVA